MQLKRSLIIALLLIIIGLGSWEMYWRAKPDYYRANLNDDRYLWAEQRAKVESANDQDVIIIGSSRTAFNFNTNIWKDVQGIKPINLSTDGKPPGPFLEDIVYNTSFKGTIIIGVTPLLFFSKKQTSRWQDAKIWADHYRDQTYAQKIGHFVSKPLQRNLIMLTSSELKFYNDLDLKSLINTIHIPNEKRVDNRSKLLNFGYNDEDRNKIMYSSMISNKDFAKKIQNVWNGFLPHIPDYKEVKDDIPEIINYFQTVTEKFKSRGGKIIFIRHKAEDPWNNSSKRLLPRDKVWDRFIETVSCPSYHFEDYEFMSKYTLPDWSHMNADDAKSYTKDMVNKLIEDDHLIKTH